MDIEQTTSSNSTEVVYPKRPPQLRTKRAETNRKRALTLWRKNNPEKVKKIEYKMREGQKKFYAKLAKKKAKKGAVKSKIKPRTATGFNYTKALDTCATEIGAFTGTQVTLSQEVATLVTNKSKGLEFNEAVEYALRAFFDKYKIEKTVSISTEALY